MTDEQSLEIAKLLHRKWKESVRFLTKIQDEQWGEAYESNNYETRLNEAELNEAKYHSLKQAFINENRVAIERAYNNVQA